MRCERNFEYRKVPLTDSMKRVLMKDIAQRANVTPATVSYVLNNARGQTISEETRNRILGIAKELGYVPNLTARTLASKKSGMIGVILVKNNSLSKPWKDILYCRFISQLEELLRKRGFNILISSVDTSKLEFDIILQRELEGVFLLDVCEDAFYNISTRFTVPIILIDSYLEDDYFLKILPDFEAAIFQAGKVLNDRYSFLIADKVNNIGYINKIKEITGLSEKDLLFAENEEEVAAFLKTRMNQKGICINEYLAMIAGNYMDQQQLVVICTCGFSDILPHKMKRVEFYDEKAELAVEMMVSYIDKDYTNDRDRYKYIRIKQ